MGCQPGEFVPGKSGLCLSLLNHLLEKAQNITGTYRFPIDFSDFKGPTGDENIIAES